MGFSLSDLIISGTLFLNAAAVINFKINRPDPAQQLTTKEKIAEFMHNLRYFRIFIALFNVFLVLLMIVFFGA